MAPALRRDSDEETTAVVRTPPPTTTTTTTPATFTSLAKQALATVALAAVFTSAGFVGEGAFSPPMTGTGAGASAGAGAGAGVRFVSPAFAELEPLPLKSYSEEFSSGLAPVNTVRGKPFAL